MECIRCNSTDPLMRGSIKDKQHYLSKIADCMVAHRSGTHPNKVKCKAFQLYLEGLGLRPIVRS